MTILFSAMTVLLASTGACEEAQVLESLNAVKAHVENGVSPATLAGLLDEARIQIDILEQGDIRRDCFVEAVKHCYYWYDLARRSRETIIANQVQRDKYDQKAIFGDPDMRQTYEKMVANYEQLIRHAYQALPSKWNNGHIALQVARECVETAKD
jgi:hypothetical protein